MKNKKLIIILISPLVLTGCKTTKITEVKKYSEILNESRDNDDFHSELYIFPEKIDEDNVLDFTYQTTEGLFSGSYLFYLLYKLDEGYDQEIERLSSIKTVFKGKGEKSILHYKKEKMFVAIYEEGARYEYVQYDSDQKTMRYVSNQFYPWDEINVKEPPKIEIPEKLLDWNEFYNIYYFYEESVGYYIED